MIIVLIGYMASGKSTIGRILANKLDYDFIDLDNYIEKKEGQSIVDIFKTKGEIYFRKKESLHLSKIIAAENNIVLSLGGGTPCYGNNMNILLDNTNVTSIYLKASIGALIERLENEKSKRPLISHLKTQEALGEFIGKHLFERIQFYSQANFTVVTNNKTQDEIIEKTILKLF